MADFMESIIHELLYQNILFFVIGGILFSATLFVQKFGLIYQYLHKVDTESNSHGGELVADTLKAHGVDYIFTLCGGHISPILVAAEKIGIRVVDTRHEVTAVFAADAVARLSGKVGVAAVTAGPGLTNTVTAVKNAQMAESPILLMGGAAASILKGRGALQDIDQMALFKPLCKYTATVTRIRDIVPTLQQAMMHAQSGTPGPVFVEFPIDSLYPYHLVKKEVMSSGGPARTLRHKIVNWYLNNYLCNLFAGAFEPQDMSPLHVNIPRATSEQIQSCADLLKKAKKPVFVFGSQALLPPVAASQLRKSVEKIGIPCFLGGMSRGLLGRNSPYHIKQNRRGALKEADLVILAGCVCDFRLGYGKVLPKKGKVIAINRNKEQLYKNSDMFWRPTVAIQADVASLIVELANQLGQNYSCDAAWLNQLKQGDIAKEKQNELKAEEPTNIHLNPIKVLHTLEETLDDNSILVADGGDFVGTAAYVVKPRGPLRWLDPGAFGTLGVGGGFALGAKLVCPDSDVWIIYGDGSLGYSVAEFDTFTRHKLPVIALVGNDAGWTQISREQVPMFGSNVGCGLAFTDYHVVAKGYGGDGVLLGRGDDIQTIFEKAKSMSREQQIPILVNCLIGKTSFRDGSISV
ncbi:2-hydroxyacyl-CoA lyase 2-like [Clavelina lepadiformis]|uniref:2-hydroxyacyl-CoA lyase 2-like n=1 Tax=Clavelina lepadiformis TaxID=159417 RepID=UPI0040426531